MLYCLPQVNESFFWVSLAGRKFSCKLHIILPRRKSEQKERALILSTMVEHSYQKVGLLPEDRDESIEEAQRVIQRSGLKYWIWKFSPYFTFHLILLALYALVTFLIIRHFQIEPLQNTAGQRLTYSKEQLAENFSCIVRTSVKVQQKTSFNTKNMCSTPPQTLRARMSANRDLLSIRHGTIF